MDKFIGFFCQIIDDNPVFFMRYSSGQVTKVSIEKIKECIEQIEEYLEVREMTR